MTHATLIRHYRDIFLLSVIGIVIGFLIGGLDAGFSWVLTTLNALRDAHPYLFLPLLPLAGLLVAFLYNAADNECYRGMALVFEAGHNERDRIPFRLLPLAIVSTWISQLFGASTGREGVGVQIGGIFGHFLGRHIPLKDASKILLLAGIAAGFSGLFHTPIAAFFFALEVLTVGRLEYEALIPVFAASFAASYVVKLLHAPAFSLALHVPYRLSWVVVTKVVLLGILFGAIGGLFAWLLDRLRTTLRSRFPEKPFAKIFVVGIVVAAALFIFGGRYAGLSEGLVRAAFTGQVFWYDWIVKMLLTIVCLAGGYRGGEVMPLFVIGATLGALVAPLVGLPTMLVVALGCAAVFGAGTNTLLAPLFLGGELFGYHYLPLFFFCCVVGYFFNGDKSIYIAQKSEMV